jgi:hypothetical protein
MKRVATALLMLSLWIVAPLAAQTDETGILEGKVEDESGNSVAIADVRIAQADGSYPGRAIADEDGYFRIGFIKPGVYDITASALGYRTAVLSQVRIRAAQVTRVTIVTDPWSIERPRSTPRRWTPRRSTSCRSAERPSI